MTFARFLVVLATCWSAGLLAAGSAIAEKQVALVIGNSAYQHVAHLPNPVNDAAAMAALLTSAGYAVDFRRDLDIRQLRRAVSALADQARDADKAIIYYAGHGIEVDGVNYLIPVDARLERDFDVEDETLSLDRLLRLIEPARRLRLVVLDACRDNPFTRTMKRSVASRSIGRGLAKVEPTIADTLVAFATEAGLVAADGDAANSPFTSALVKHIATPGLDLRLAFGRVRDEVMRETGNKQRPFVYGSLGGSTVAITDAPASPISSLAAPPPTALNPCAAAETHWKSAEAIGTVAVLEDHRKRFPGCPFALLAQARIDALQRHAALPGSQPRSTHTEQYHYLVGLDQSGDNWLALRSEPSGTRGVRLLKMGPETLLTVIGRSGDWLNVRLPTGQAGWAHSRYIACCREAAPSTARTSARRCIVADPTGTPLNVRRSPNGELTGAVLRNGTTVQIASRSADSQGRPWAFVSVSDDGGGQKRLGYVFMDHIKCDAP
jgi:hypothetical protein